MEVKDDSQQSRAVLAEYRFRGIDRKHTYVYGVLCLAQYARRVYAWRDYARRQYAGAITTPDVASTAKSSLRTWKQCGGVAWSKISRTSATATPSCAICVLSASGLRILRDLLRPQPLLFCPSCSRFSLRKNSSCASLRSYFDEVATSDFCLLSISATNEPFCDS